MMMTVYLFIGSGCQDEGNGMRHDTGLNLKQTNRGIRTTEDERKNIRWIVWNGLKDKCEKRVPVLGKSPCMFRDLF